jgi:hypothetical protein
VGKEGRVAMIAHKLMLVAMAVLCATVGGLALASSHAFAEKVYVPGISFGAPGSGPGQLSEPVGVAVNDASSSLEPVAGGDVYVVDRGNDRVERFSETGQYEGQFDGGATYEVQVQGQGKQEPTTQAPSGTFSSPGEIAIDDAQTSVSFGDVYVDYKADEDGVADYGGPKAIDEFSPVGAYLGDITEAVCVPPEEERQLFEEHFCKAGVLRPFEEVSGMAVDRSGDLWVLYTLPGEGHDVNDFNTSAYIGEFGPNGQFIKASYIPGWQEEVNNTNGLTVDSAGDVYDIAKEGAVGLLVKFANGGREGWLAKLGLEGSTVAVNPVTNNLIVDEVDSVALLGPFGEPYTPIGHGKGVSVEPVESFPNGGLPESLGVAVNAEATVYASELKADRVQSFDFLPAPTVKTLTASGVSETELTLHGTVNPEGEAVKECYFEYGTEADVYTKTAECDPKAGELGEGTNAIPVQAVLSGLAPAGVRSFRLVAVSAHGVVREGEGKIVARPVLKGVAIADVGSSAATVVAQIEPGGLQTCYTIEYCLGEIAGEECIGAGNEPVGVSAELRGLASDTECHFRIVASNVLGTEVGEEVTFATFAPTSSELPDGRVYELVSDTGTNHGEVYVPGGLVATGLDLGGIHGITTELPFEAAEGEGEAVSYLGDPPARGGDSNVGVGGGNQYVARRSPAGGWAYVDLNAPGYGSDYVSLAEDLSVGVLSTSELVRTYEGLPAEAQEGYANLYRRSIGWQSNMTGSSESLLGSFEPLITAKPPCEPPEFGAIENNALRGKALFGGGNSGSGAAPVYSHLLFEVNAALSSTPRASGPADCGVENDLYDWVAGRLRLVNVLPEGGAQANATFGRQGPYTNGYFSPETSNVISSDGSRIYWSAVEAVAVGSEYEERPKALYVRENDTQPQSKIVGERCSEPAKACTVQVDASGLPGTEKEKEEMGGSGAFWTASSNGSKVFFTDEKPLTAESTAEVGAPDLYEYDLEAADGERLSDLSVPVKPGVGADVQGVVGASEDGSYVYFVADGVLTEGKNVEGGEPVEGQPNLYLRHAGRTTFVATLAVEDGDFTQGKAGNDGDWQADPGHRTAEVTPDGHSVVFMSRRSLAGYDNVLGGTPLAEVFVYDAETGRLVCASCNPSGEGPTGNIYPEFAKFVPGELGVGSAKVWGSFVPVSDSLADYQPRVVSDDGGRVFFDSVEPLVPGATNGFLNVYEWERGGLGSCGEVRGCVFLLSGGQSSENSYLVDASANGEEVFFVSRAQLVKGVPGGFDELYDARVGGVVALEGQRCSGTGCQGVPPAAPGFVTPPSVMFSGVGNFPPPSVAAVCRKGSKLRSGKCVKSRSACSRGKRLSGGRCVKKASSGGGRGARGRRRVRRGKSGRGQR